MSNLAYQDESTYTLQQLAADVETIVADKQEHASIVAAAEPLLERFLTTNSLPEEYCQPFPDRITTEHKEFTLYRLHRGPEDCFNIMAAIWPPGGSSGVHDHAGKWVVEGVYRNQLHTIRYKRLDDGTHTGHAELKETVSLDLHPGSVSHVLSPNEEVHDFINQTNEPVVSVHIYGGDISTETLNYFDPAAQTVEQIAHDLRYDNE